MGEGRRQGNEKERKETFSPFPEIFFGFQKEKKGGVKEKVLGGGRRKRVTNK